MAFPTEAEVFAAVTPSEGAMMPPPMVARLGCPATDRVLAVRLGIHPDSGMIEVTRCAAFGNDTVRCAQPCLIPELYG